MDRKDIAVAHVTVPLGAAIVRSPGAMIAHTADRRGSAVVRPVVREVEALRRPSEDHVVTISRARGTVAFPAQFTLVPANRPCPCVRKYHSAA